MVVLLLVMAGLKPSGIADARVSGVDSLPVIETTIVLALLLICVLMLYWGGASTNRYKVMSWFYITSLAVLIFGSWFHFGTCGILNNYELIAFLLVSVVPIIPFVCGITKQESNDNMLIFACLLVWIGGIILELVAGSLNYGNHEMGWLIVVYTIMFVLFVLLAKLTDKLAPERAKERNAQDAEDERKRRELEAEKICQQAEKDKEIIQSCLEKQQKICEKAKKYKKTAEELGQMEREKK